MKKIKMFNILNGIILIILIFTYLGAIVYNLPFYYFGQSSISNSVISLLHMIVWCVFVFMPQNKSKIMSFSTIIFWSIAVIFNWISMSINSIEGVYKLLSVGCILFRIPFHGIDLFSSDGQGVLLGQYIYDTNMVVTIILSLFAVIFITTCLIKIKKAEK